MSVNLRAEYQVKFQSQGASIGEGTFTMPIASGMSALVRVDRHLVVVEGHNLPLSDGLMAWLKAGQPKLVTEWPVELSDEIDKLHAQLETLARLPTALAKYFLGFSSISDDLVSFGKMDWSTDLTEWHRFPFKMTMTGWSSSQIPISEAVKPLLQQDIDTQVRPFLAMRHLHRAIAEAIPRFKWIEATIAAELAIKEALLVAKPELATLLLDMPSPPLAKLYGSTMKQYLGEVSPYRKALVEGSEMRNKLVHRPMDHTISLSDATEYVSTVEKAIFHLLRLVYPNSKILSLTKGVIQHY